MNPHTSESHRTPYLGSILFFKHVFLALCLLVFIVPICLSIRFCVKSNRLSSALEDATATLLENETYIAQLESDALQGADTQGVDAADATNEIGVSELYDMPDYCTLYPDLYIEGGIAAFDESTAEPTVYLTFDDGPSTLTSQVLDTLDAYDIDATFFIVGSSLTDPENAALLSQAYADGHSIGVHTQSGDYATIYASVEDYLADFYTVWMRIYEITGEKTQIFRFAGGSINTYNSTIYQEIIAEMTRRGFVYYDWNISAGDETSALSASEIYTNATSNDTDNNIFLLLHDGDSAQNTISALPDIIEYYMEEGYAFSPITARVKPVVFSYIN